MTTNNLPEPDGYRASASTPNRKPPQGGSGTATRKMRAFAVTITGVWLSGKAIVVAETQEQAIKVLREACEGQMLPQADEPWELREIDLTRPNAVIVFNGDY